jgi:hypothetical protein
MHAMAQLSFLGTPTLKTYTPTLWQQGGQKTRHYFDRVEEVGITIKPQFFSKK